MAKLYDLVVVGGGPAGLMAAKTAGENGLKVALLERKEHITDVNRACTMMVLVLNEYIFGERITFNQKDGRLTYYRIGRHVYFKKGDIMQALEDHMKYKHRRFNV